MRQVTRTTVGIVGAGPAGLMLSHLLARAGIDSVAIDIRSRREIEETVRAGILEADSVRLLVDTGVSDRVLREGHAHEGIDLRFGGVSHRIDFQGLVGHSVWLYPQTDVFSDLAEARTADGAGQITLILDDSEVTLHAGDIVVQRGTDHAWANRGDTTAKVVFVLIDGEFDPNLAATLPGGLEALMHGGPRD